MEETCRLEIKGYSRKLTLRKTLVSATVKPQAAEKPIGFLGEVVREKGTSLTRRVFG